MLLDMGIGLLLSFGIGICFGIESKIWFSLAGVGFALAPDLDTLFYLLVKKRIEKRIIYKHREILHFPLIFCFVTPVFCFWLGFPYALLWLTAILCHFIHDSVDDDGWGIQWFWPFSKNYFMITKYSPKIIFTQKEREKLAEKHADPDWWKKENFRHSVCLGFGLASIFFWLFYF